MYKHEFWFRESWTNKACLIVYNLAKSPDIISEADNNNTSMMHTWNQIFSKCHLPWGTNFQKDYWYHETTSTNLICVYQPNFMTGIVDIRCLAPGKRVSKYSQWVWKQLHKNKRNHECINCPLFGHRNKSRWRYHGGDIRDVLIFISHNNPKFPGLEQKKMFKMILLFLILNIPLQLASFVRPKCFWKVKNIEYVVGELGICGFLFYTVPWPLDIKDFIHSFNEE